MTILKPGVTIMLAGVSEEDYKAFGEACIAAGANVGEFPSPRQRAATTAFGWSINNNSMYHFLAKHSDDTIQIVTVAEALGRTDNDRHKRVELPPVGSHLEVTFGNKSIWHECVLLPGKKIAIDRYAGWHVMGWQDDFEFRPIKTEREKFVERFNQEWHAQNKPLYEFAAAQYDKGLRYVD